MIFDVLTENNYDPVTGDIKDYKIRKAFRVFFHDYSKTHVLSAEQKKAGECSSRCKTGFLSSKKEIIILYRKHILRERTDLNLTRSCHLPFILPLSERDQKIYCAKRNLQV